MAQHSNSDEPDVPVLLTDFSRLGAWMTNAIDLGTTEMLAQQLGHPPAEGERILLCDLLNLEAFADLVCGELGGDTVWFGRVDLDTVSELGDTAAEAIVQYWANHPPPK